MTFSCCGQGCYDILYVSILYPFCSSQLHRDESAQIVHCFFFRLALHLTLGTICNTDTKESILYQHHEIDGIEIAAF